MNIEHMGEKVVELLLEKGLIKRISDIYLLDGKMLEILESFKEKSIKNLLESIEKSKQCSLDRLILGMEIEHVGKETAQLLAKNAGTLENLMEIKKERLMEIDGIGEKAADSIVAFFIDKTNLEEIRLLLLHGVRPQKVLKVHSSHVFADKTFVLTGTLEKYSREEASLLIRERGGRVSSSVSAKTDYVLVGSDPGSKYGKAKRLGVKILLEKDFESILHGQENTLKEGI